MHLKSLLFLFFSLFLTLSKGYADIQYQATPNPVRLELQGKINYIYLARDNFYGKRLATTPQQVTLFFQGSEATSKRKRIRVMLEQYLVGTGNKFELQFNITNYSSGSRFYKKEVVQNGRKNFNAIFIDVDANIRQVSFTINPEIVAVATSLERETVTYSSARFENYDMGYITVTDDNDISIRGAHGTPETAIKPIGLNLKVESSTCDLLTEKNININMKTTQVYKLRQEREIESGNFEIRLGNCGAGVAGFFFSSNAIEKIFITFSDASTPSNYGDILSLSEDATASGIGIKIYPENSSQAIKFGPPSRIKGNLNAIPFRNYIKPTNDWGSASQRYIVKYALDPSTPLQPGSVISRATFTFSYQ